MSEAMCPVRQAEIINDSMTPLQERQILEENHINYLNCVSQLLNGDTVDVGGRAYKLYDRLYEEHVAFAFLVENDIDYMWLYKEKIISQIYANVIEKEAEILASIIVG